MKTGTIMGVATALRVDSLSDYNDYFVGALVAGKECHVYMAGVSDDGYMLVVGAPGAALLLVPLPMFAFGVYSIVAANHKLLGEKRGKRTYKHYRAMADSYGVRIPRLGYQAAISLFAGGVTEALFLRKIKTWRKREAYQYTRPRRVFTTVDVPAEVAARLA